MRPHCAKSARRRGRLHGHHIVADRLIEMFAIGVDVEEAVALEHRLFQLGDFRQGRVHRRGRAGGNRREAIEPHRGPALARPFAIGVDIFVRARTADGGQAGAVHILHHRHGAGFVDRLRRVGPRFGNRTGPFDADDAGRFSARIAPDPGVGLLVQPHDLDGLAVHIGAAAGELQLHRIVGRDRIQFFAGEILFVVGELVRREAAQRIDPFAGFQGRRLGADHLQRLFARGDPVEAQFLQPDAALLHDVGVVVDHAGNDGFAAQIDAPRVRSRKPRDVLIGAHRDHAVAPDRHRLRDREAVIDGDDLPVRENHVGCSGLRMHNRRRAQKRDEHSGHIRRRNPMFHGTLR